MKTHKLIATAGVAALSLSGLAACSGGTESSIGTSHKYSVVEEDVLDTIPEGWEALVASLDEALSEIPDAVETAEGRSAWVAKWQYERWTGTTALNLEYDSYEMGDCSCVNTVWDGTWRKEETTIPCEDVGREKIEEKYSASDLTTHVKAEDIWHLRGTSVRISENDNGMPTTTCHLGGDGTEDGDSEFLKQHDDSWVPFRTDGTFTPANLDDKDPLNGLLELAVHLQEPDAAIITCDVKKDGGPSITCYMGNRKTKEVMYDDETPITVKAWVVNTDKEKMCKAYAAKPDNSTTEEDCKDPSNVDFTSSDFTPNELINDFGGTVTIPGPEKSHLDWTGHQDIIAPWSKK